MSANDWFTRARALMDRYNTMVSRPDVPLAEAASTVKAVVAEADALLRERIPQIEDAAAREVCSLMLLLLQLAVAHATTTMDAAAHRRPGVWQ